MGDRVAHVLLLGNARLAADDIELRDRMAAEAVAEVDRIYAGGGEIAAVVTLGDMGAAPTPEVYEQVEVVVEAIFTAVLEYDHVEHVPSVVDVPGIRDRAPVTGMRATIDALDSGWDRIAAELWSGEYNDITAVVARSFSEFGQWRSRHYSSSQDGTLPGDSATTVAVRGVNIGIIGVSSVFRQLGDHPIPPTIHPEQVEQITGGLTHWASAHDVVLLVSNGACAFPFEPGVSSVRFCASRSGADGADWTALGDGKWLTTVRIASAGGVPTVTMDGRPITVAAVRPPVSAAVADLVEPAETGNAQESEFAKVVASGRMLLVVVSGLSALSRNRFDEPLDEPSDLRDRLLAQLGHDPASPAVKPPLTEVLKRAARNQRFAAILDRVLVAEPGQIDRTAVTLLRAPWHRVYDFSGSNVLRLAAKELDPAAADIIVVNSTVSPPTPNPSALIVTAMNGIAGVPKTPNEFGRSRDGRQDPRSLWYQRFATDILLYPAVFVVADTGDPLLDYVLENVDEGGEQHQPRYLVGPGDDDVRWRLDGFGIKSFGTSIAEFAASRLGTNRQEVADGNRVLARQRANAKRGVGVKIVRHLIEAAAPGEKDFLRGYEPTWGVVKDRFAARLHHVDEVKRATRSGASSPIVILRGTAGSGKSTTLLRAAMEMSEQGQVVGWVDRAATHKITRIIEETNSLGLDAVVIDDVDMFGQQCMHVLQQLNNQGRCVVVASIRTTRLDVVGAGKVNWVDQDDQLTDKDLHELIKVLRQQGLLGELKELREAGQRVAKLRKICDRELLAAMVRVVTGEKFEDRIRREYRDLGPEAQIVYRIASVFCAVQHEESSILTADLVEVAEDLGIDKRGGLSLIRKLLAQRLLVPHGQDRVRCRHRQVADRIVMFLKSQEQDDLWRTWNSLLWHFASRASRITDRNNPSRRTMVRLLSHTLAVDLRISAQRVREAYESVHGFLEDDFHYWLHRGSFEMERGDLDLAASYLDSARGCTDGHDDYKVLTAWGAIALRRSKKNPGHLELREKAFQAHEHLWQVIRSRGGESPHTFVALIRDGYEWLLSATLAEEDRSRIVRSLSKCVDLASISCPNNPECGEVIREYRPKIAKLMNPSKGIPI